MAKTRSGKFSPEFKAKVAIQALENEDSVYKLASRFNIHPTVIMGWRNKLLEQAWEIFNEMDPGLDKAGQRLTAEEYSYLFSLWAD